MGGWPLRGRRPRDLIGMAPLPLQTPYPESRATLDGPFCTLALNLQFYDTADVDNTQCRPSKTKGVLQRTNVARPDLAVSNEEAQKNNLVPRAFLRRGEDA